MEYMMDELKPSDDERKNFRSNLARFMKNQGLTAERLAAKIRCDGKSVDRWLQGKTFPQPDMRQALIGYFGLSSFAELFTSEEASQLTQSDGVVINNHASNLGAQGVFHAPVHFYDRRMKDDE